MDLEIIPEDIFTAKDLVFLSDMFHKCYDAYKNTYFNIDFIKNKSVLEVYQKAMELFDDELKIAIRILKNPGGEIDE